jgi:branched-chain amino acid transport system substrate-binding protein
MLLAMAIKQAGTTDGVKLREALENLQAPYEGIMKTYGKPFSKTTHEALLSPDYKWAQWKDGKLVSYSDDVINSLKDSDFRK